MSEISITRFQPALVTREKVNSVESVENDLDGNAEGQEQQQQQRQDAQSERPPKDSGTKQASTPRTTSASQPVDANDEERLEQAVSRLNKYVQTVKRDLIFDIDPESQEPSVTVVDRESRQVLRHFNSEEALELAKKLESQESISLFKTQV